MRFWLISTLFVVALAGCPQGEGSTCQQQTDCPASFLCCGASAPGAPVVRFGVCQRSACVTTVDASNNDARIDATTDASDGQVTTDDATRDSAVMDATSTADAAPDQGAATDAAPPDATPADATADADHDASTVTDSGSTDAAADTGADR